MQLNNAITTMQRGVSIILKDYFLKFTLVVSFILVFSSMVAPLFQEYRMYGISEPLYKFDGWVCHQLPTKCIWLFNRPMGLCGRCFGIYTGAFLLSLMLLVNHATIQTSRVGFFIIPMSVDIGAKILGWQGTRGIGFLTGFLAAIGAEGLIVFLTTRQSVNTRDKGGDNPM